MQAFMAATQTTQSNPLVTLLPFLAIGGLFYFMLIRPQRRQRQVQQQMIQAVEKGDEVVMSGGIFGTVIELDDDTVTVEIAPGTNVRFLRRAIVQRLTEPSEPDQEADGRS